MNRSAQHIRQQMMNLRALAELLVAEAEQLPCSAAEPQMLCRDSVAAIRALLPELEATTWALIEHEGVELLRQGARLCEGCED